MVPSGLTAGGLLVPNLFASPRYLYGFERGNEVHHVGSRVQGLFAQFLNCCPVIAQDFVGVSCDVGPAVGLLVA